MRMISFFAVLVLAGLATPAVADYKVEKSYGMVTQDSPYLDGELEPVVKYTLKFPNKIKTNPEYENIVMKSVNTAVEACRNEANQLVKGFNDFVAQNYLNQDSSLVKNLIKNISDKYQDEAQDDYDKALGLATAEFEQEITLKIQATKEPLVVQYNTLINTECKKNINQAIETGWEEVKKQNKEYKSLKVKVDREIRKANWKVAGGVAKIVAGTISGAVGGALIGTGAGAVGGSIMVVGGALGIIKGGVDIAKGVNDKLKAVAQLKPDLEKAAVNIRNAKSGMEAMARAIQEEKQDLEALAGIMKALQPLIMQEQANVLTAENELGQANDQNRDAKQEQLNKAKTELNKQYKQAYDAQQLFMRKYFATNQTKTSVTQLKVVETELTNYKTQSGLLLKQINKHSMEAEALMKKAVTLESEVRKLISKTDPNNKKEMLKVQQAQDEMKKVLKKLNQILMTIEGERKWRKEAAQFSAEVEEEVKSYSVLIKKYQDSVKGITLDANFDTGKKIDTTMTASLDWMSTYGSGINDILSAANSILSSAVKVETEYGLLTTVLDVLTSLIGV